MKCFKFWDFVIIGFVFLLSLSSISFFSNDSGETVEIYSGSELYAVYSINKDETLDIRTKYGYNRVVIKNNEVYVSDASCPDKNDVKQGKIYKSGQSIICLPNKLIVTIKGGADIEALSY